MTGPFVRRMFNLILRIISCHTSELLRHDSDTYSQTETGTEATEIHREKKVGYLRWQETDSGAAAARKKKKKKADHMGKPPKPGKDRSKLRQAGRLIGVLQEVTFTKKAV